MGQFQEKHSQRIISNVIIFFLTIVNKEVTIRYNTVPGDQKLSLEYFSTFSEHVEINKRDFIII